MNTFTIILFISLAVAAALAFPDGDDGHYGHHDHHDHHGHHEHEVGDEGDHHHPAGYQFEYGVYDPHTKDHKSQREHRDKDDVKGLYTIHDPDGTKRIVEYTSGKHKGFQALVKREGHAQHPAVYGDKKGHGKGGTSYVGVTHWGHGSGK